MTVVVINVMYSRDSCDTLHWAMNSDMSAMWSKIWVAEVVHIHGK